MNLIKKFVFHYVFSIFLVNMLGLFLSKPKKSITITNAFQKILNESGRKPKQIWVDKGSEFYNRSIKSSLEKNDIEMYSTHNAIKSAAAERLIWTLKNKIHK